MSAFPNEDSNSIFFCEFEPRFEELKAGVLKVDGSGFLEVDETFLMRRNPGDFGLVFLQKVQITKSLKGKI